MPTLRIHNENEYLLHFLTLRVIDWIDIFTKPIYFQSIINTLKYYQTNNKLLIYGYVIMTNHLHLIVQCKKDKLSSTIKSFKSYTTHKAKKLLKTDNRKYILNLIKRTGSKRKYNNFQLWHSENWPIPLESDKLFMQKLTYIHNNPVVKNYVEQAEDWLYSSARNYILDDNSVIKIDKPY